jgi:hypothetical protein
MSEPEHLTVRNGSSNRMASSAELRTTSRISATLCNAMNKSKRFALGVAQPYTEFPPSMIPSQLVAHDEEDVADFSHSSLP